LSESKCDRAETGSAPVRRPPFGEFESELLEKYGKLTLDPFVTN
jgi:hypothetical protein